MKEPRRKMKSGYLWWGCRALDIVCCLLLIPASHLLSLVLSCYYPTTHDSKNILIKLFKFLVIGPILLRAIWLLLPWICMGYIVSVMLCSFGQRHPFHYSCPSACSQEESVCPRKITLLTANVILAHEIFVRINNNRSVYWRIFEIPRRLLRQNPELNKNRNMLSDSIQREDVVIDGLPDVDVVMLQEVFSREFGYQVAKTLKEKYPYCLYDVANHSISSNFCLLGSGLFLASRFPILEAEFHGFTYKIHYAKCMDYGVLIAKLNLGTTDSSKAAVGYISNLHTQAFQGKKPVIAHQLEEAREWTEEFIQKTFCAEKEVMMFTVMGGDFNCDNMSPGDQATQNHSLWSWYKDVCQICPGKDAPWSLGTELRLLTLHKKEMQDPQAFRSILLDDIKRRYYILDADVEEQTSKLMTCIPKSNALGKVEATVTGGRRRIDHLILRSPPDTAKENADKFKDSKRRKTLNPVAEKEINSVLKERVHCKQADKLPCPVSGTPMIITAAWFSTALAGLSDHIPYLVQLESTAPAITRASPLSSL